MRFFEPPAPPPPPEPSPQPDWVAPPAGVVPGLAPVEFLLARSAEAAVAISGAWAYPTGVELRVTVLLRTADPRVDEAIFSPWLVTTGSQWVVTTGAGPPDEFLRLGVQLVDGRKATNLDHRGDDPAPPVLMQGGGHGSDVLWVSHYWLWPLPPAGPLAFVVEWPAKEIPETRAEIDASLLHTAAERAVTLWP